MVILLNYHTISCLLIKVKAIIHTHLEHSPLPFSMVKIAFQTLVLIMYRQHFYRKVQKQELFQLNLSGRYVRKMQVNGYVFCVICFLRYCLKQAPPKAQLPKTETTEKSYLIHYLFAISTFILYPVFR